MPLTADELRDNYYFACLLVAGAPYVYFRPDIVIRDAGGSSMPTPHIYTWTVTGIPKPTDAYLMSYSSMVMINTLNLSMQ